MFTFRKKGSSQRGASDNGDVVTVDVLETPGRTKRKRAASEASTREKTTAKRSANSNKASAPKGKRRRETSLNSPPPEEAQGGVSETIKQFRAARDRYADGKPKYVIAAISDILERFEAADPPEIGSETDGRSEKQSEKGESATVPISEEAFLRTEVLRLKEEVEQWENLRRIIKGEKGRAKPVQLSNVHKQRLKSEIQLGSTSKDKKGRLADVQALAKEVATLRGQIQKLSDWNDRANAFFDDMFDRFEANEFNAMDDIDEPRKLIESVASAAKADRSAGEP